MNPDVPLQHDFSVQGHDCDLMAPKARGGLHGRLAAAAPAAAAPPEPPSRLANLLLDQWVWGDMSAAQVQRFASAAVSDGAKHRDLMLLASIGSQGTCPGNCHRDLVEYRLRKPELLTALSDVKIWVRKPPLHSIEADQKILLPHDLIGQMYLHHADSFTSLILGGGPAKCSVVFLFKVGFRGGSITPHRPTAPQLDHTSHPFPNPAPPPTPMHPTSTSLPPHPAPCRDTPPLPHRSPA